MLIIKVDIRDYGLRPRAYKCPMINVISFSVTKIHLTPLSPLKINTSQDLHLGLASLTFANIFNMWYFPQKKKKMWAQLSIYSLNLYGWHSFNHMKYSSLSCHGTQLCLTWCIHLGSEKKTENFLSVLNKKILGIGNLDLRKSLDILKMNAEPSKSSPWITVRHWSSKWETSGLPLGLSWKQETVTVIL